MSISGLSFFMHKKQGRIQTALCELRGFDKFPLSHH